MSLPERDMTFVQQLVLDRAAIALDDKQRYLVESRLLPVAREAGAADIPALVETLRRSAYGDLHQRVVEAMTTNETSFFRDSHPFEALKRKIIPDLIQQRQAERRLHIWSAASSSGQEAYSILMLLRDEFPALTLGWTIRVYGSDYSQNMLRRAKEGRYNSLEVGRGLPAAALIKHFDRVGAEWQVKPALRHSVEWFHTNLAGTWPVLPAIDLLLIRNVLIYFKSETRAAILEKARRTMQPRGYLMLGTTETPHGLTDKLIPETFGPTVYYRVAP
jgi:chemotaxis protein methyltransferase CheR